MQAVVSIWTKVIFIAIGMTESLFNILLLDHHGLILLTYQGSNK